MGKKKPNKEERVKMPLRRKTNFRPFRRKFWLTAKRWMILMSTPVNAYLAVPFFRYSMHVHMCTWNGVYTSCATYTYIHSNVYGHIVFAHASMYVHTCVCIILLKSSSLVAGHRIVNIVPLELKSPNLSQLRGAFKYFSIYYKFSQSTNWDIAELNRDIHIHTHIYVCTVYFSGTYTF